MFGEALPRTPVLPYNGSVLKAFWPGRKLQYGGEPDELKLSQSLPAPQNGVLIETALLFHVKNNKSSEVICI